VHRVDREIVGIGEELGVAVEVHDGHTSGQRLIALVRRTDVVILVMGIVSHAAACVAKREAARTGVPVHVLKSCSCSAARALLARFVRQAAS
jgi:hypothetical protein